MSLRQMTPWDRRAFLAFLAASPLVGGLPDAARALLAARQGQPARGPITDPANAVDVFDFEVVAKEKLASAPAHWAYMATGVDSETTMQANRDGFARLALRSRRLIDVSKVDLGITLLGQSFDTPIFICPTSSNKAFHPQGELAVARAAKAKGHLQMLSTVATLSIEDAIAARGAPVWYQLYPPRDWEACKKMVRRAEAAGAPVLLLTVDLNPGSNRETLERGRQVDPRKCETCHESPRGGGDVKRKPMFDGLGPNAVPYNNPDVTWDMVKRLRDVTTMRIGVKGIVTREDAELAVKHGVDLVYVSNHGGRADDGGIGTIESLPEVVAAVKGKVPVLLDSGVRRGTDIVKALALGASAVGIGRPYLWGLTAFGQAGVERVLDLLRAELTLAMQHTGATSVRRLTRGMVVPAGRSAS